MNKLRVSETYIYSVHKKCRLRERENAEDRIGKRKQTNRQKNAVGRALDSEKERCRRRGGRETGGRLPGCS